MSVTTFVDGVTTVLASWLNFQDLHTQDVPASGTAHAASKISNTPAGGIAATNIQTAINELDTEKANLASPTFTGTPAAPTAAVDTNTTQVATTGFVLAQAASATPTATGTAAVGTSTRYARGDHVHNGGPAFDAWASGAQNINNGTDTKILFATEVFDTDSCFASSRFTPTVAGYYLFTGALSITAAGAGGVVSAKIWKNGSQTKIGASFSIGAAGDFTGDVTAIIYMNGSTDYVELYGYQTTGGTRAVVNVSYSTYFSGHFIRA